MRKQLLLFAAALLGTVSAGATEIWSGSCAIANWSGSEVTVDKSAFESVSAGDIIKVTLSAYAETESDGETTVTYWQYALGQKDNGWVQLTGFAGGDLQKGAASASYTLTETNATELKTYGLSVNGRYITVSKVELLTAATENLWTGSISTGDYGSTGGTDMLALSYGDRGNLAATQKNDYIQVTYTVLAADAKVDMQNPAGWTSVANRSDGSYTAEGDNTGRTFAYAIDNATLLEAIQQNGLLVRGKNITITSVDLVKPSNRYDAVPLTIGADGLATFGSSKNLDFSALAAVTPYYVSKVETGVVQLSPVDITRAYTGYVVKGTAGTYDIPVTASEPEWTDAFHYLRYAGDYDGNKVYRSAYTDYSGGGDDETKIKTYYRYILAKNGDQEPSFYKLAEDYSRTDGGNTVCYHILNAHKAYLETSTDIQPTADARVSLVFDDETAHIQRVENRGNATAVCYTLSGVPVARPTKGIYLVNGKKTIIK